MPTTASNEIGNPEVIVAPDVAETMETVTPTVPASALGLESPKDFLEKAASKVRDRLPKPSVPPPKDFSKDLPPRDATTGKFQPKAAPKPAAPVEPAPAPEVKPPAPAAPAKIKVGGKEYSESELEALLNKPAAPAPASLQQKPEPPPAPKGPTPEELAATAKAEAAYLQELTEKSTPGLTEAEVDNILIGGAEGAARLNAALAKVAAKTRLETEKQVYASVNKQLDALHAVLAPMIQQSAELERITLAQTFVQRWPEYEGNIDMAKAVAEELAARYPDQTRAMSRDQFLQEVERQTDQIAQNDFKRWNPQYQGTWKDYVKAQKAAVAAPSPPALAPAPVIPPQVIPTPKPRLPTPKPPATNSPGASTSGLTPNFQRAVAASLLD